MNSNESRNGSKMYESLADIRCQSSLHVQYNELTLYSTCMGIIESTLLLAEG